MSCQECGKTDIHWCFYDETRDNTGILRDGQGVPCCDDRDLRYAGRDGRDITVWQCRFCFYWERTIKRDGVLHGQCRIRPPHAQTLAGYTASVWPVTQEDDWCGEFTEDGAR